MFLEAFHANVVRIAVFRLPFGQIESFINDVDMRCLRLTAVWQSGPGDLVRTSNVSILEHLFTDVADDILQSLLRAGWHHCLLVRCDHV